MGKETTYLNLFRNYREVLRQYSAPLMDSKREAAIGLFEKAGFPGPKDEAYRQCRLDALLEIDYGMNLYRLSAPAHPSKVFRCEVPSLSTKLFFVVNDVYYPDPDPQKLSEGVLYGSINAILREYPELMAPYYDRIAGQSADAFAALNTAMAQDGFLLFVPAGVEIEQPLQLIQLFHGEIEQMANRRNLVIIEDGASAKLMICDHSMTQSSCFSNQVTEVFVGKKARLEYYELEMTHPNNARLSNTFIDQQASSSVFVNGITLNNGVSRNNLNLRMLGEQAESMLSGLCLLDSHQFADYHVDVEHVVPQCTSRQLYKYILDDESRGVFAGKVLVHPNAQKTSAYQSNANLCNSSRARMNALPQLEIYADDVKCSHGSATGQIDENALFYMRSRGLSEQEARAMLKFAFVADVIEGIQLIPLKNRIHNLVGKRFRKQMSACAGCDIC
ncbi:MAG: Fe-S cluster assembly protein SufD [Bacteroidales bacterium]|nr:Fe-S cluster assembly protein SufD [Bacteroidales bacterium]